MLMPDIVADSNMEYKLHTYGFVIIKHIVLILTVYILYHDLMVFP